MINQMPTISQFFLTIGSTSYVKTDSLHNMLGLFWRGKREPPQWSKEELQPPAATCHQLKRAYILFVWAVTIYWPSNTRGN